MNRVLFVITTLGSGGAERIVSYLANYFADIECYDVELLLLRSEGNTYLDSLNKNIKVTNLRLKSRLRFNVLKIVYTILKIKPDICFVGLDGLNILLAPFVPILKLAGTKMVVRETNVLSHMWSTNIVNRLAYRIFYNNYNSVICQSNDMANDLIDVWKIKKKKITIINNPIDVKLVEQKSKIPMPSEISHDIPFFVAVGRLVPQKGFEKLVKIIRRLNENGKFPYRLIIIGDGELKNKLNIQIEEYGLVDKVKLLGRIENPYCIIKNAIGFILSSEFEGFPNVLLEANALGIPVLANRCPGGINEIVIEGVNGYSADFNDFADFEEKYDRFLITNFNHNKIKELNSNRYDSSVIISKYQALIEKCLVDDKI